MATSTTFKLTIACDNDSFGPTQVELRDQLAGILQQIAQTILQGHEIGYHQNIFDDNGNTVGTYALKDIDPDQSRENYPKILRG